MRALIEEYTRVEIQHRLKGASHERTQEGTSGPWEYTEGKKALEHLR